MTQSVPSMNSSITSSGSQIYVEIPSHLAAQIQSIATSSNTVEDVHICGSCKRNFSDIELFVQHKTTCSLSPQNLSITQNQTSLGFLAPHNSSENNEDPSFGQPLFKVIFDGPNETQTLRARILELPEQETVDTNQQNFQQLNAIHSVVVSEQQQHNENKRTFQIDEEDVATLLANHLASEVPDATVSSSRPELLDISTEINQNSSNSIGLSSVSTPVDSSTQFIPAMKSLRNQNIEQSLSQCEEEKESNGDTSRSASTNQENEEPNMTNVSVNTVSHSAQTMISNVRIVVETRKRKKRHKCSSCNFTTLYLKDLVRHVRRHTGERPFVCDSCQRSFSRADKLHMHQRIHSGEKPHHCQHCDYATIDSGSLRKHMRIHNDERPYKCQMCPYRSRDSSQLTVHLRTHTGDCPFMCTFDNCASTFKTSSDLKRHVRIHTGEKPFECSLCGYKCAIKSNLRVHLRLSHSDSRHISCNTCDFVGNSIRAVKEHEKTHADEIMKCATCSYISVNAACMKSHLKVHSQEKPYSCKYCSFACRYQGNLKGHVQRRHPEMSQNSKKSKLADKESSEDRNSPSHPSAVKGLSNSKPLYIKPYKCTYCDAAFVREDSWRSHTRQHQAQFSSTKSPHCSVADDKTHKKNEMPVSVESSNGTNNKNQVMEESSLQKDSVIQSKQIMEEPLQKDSIIQSNQIVVESSLQKDSMILSNQIMEEQNSIQKDSIMQSDQIMEEPSLEKESVQSNQIMEDLSLHKDNIIQSNHIIVEPSLQNDNIIPSNQITEESSLQKDNIIPSKQNKEESSVQKNSIIQSNRAKEEISLQKDSIMQSGYSLVRSDKVVLQTDQQSNKSVCEHSEAMPRTETALIQISCDGKDKDNSQTVNQSSESDVIDTNNVQTQPIIVYVQNASHMLHGGFDNTIRNAEILTPTPIIVAGNCNQYLSVPLEQTNTILEQFAASLPQGMQYIVSTPVEGVVGSNTTYVFTSS